MDLFRTGTSRMHNRTNVFTFCGCYARSESWCTKVKVRIYSVLSEMIEFTRSLDFLADPFPLYPQLQDDFLNG